MHRGWIVQPASRVRDDRALVELHGRLENGAAFLVEDDRFRPYFFVRPQDAEILSAVSDVEIEACGLTDPSGQPVLRVITALPSMVPALRERLHRRGLPAWEADVRFAYRYLMDAGLRCEIAIEGRAEHRSDGRLVFRNPTLRAASSEATLRELSLDLETSPDASEIFSFALAGCDIEEVQMVSRRPVAGACCHESERDLLRALAARIRELDPDLLVGWNVVDFDLRVFARRCQQLGLAPAEAALGRSDEPIRFPSDASFTRQARAQVVGRMVLDGIPLVRDAMKLGDYRLDTVARAVLGRGKLIDEDAADAAAEIARMRSEDPDALVAYNLEDARLVREILAKEGLVALARERSRLTGMQLDRVGASIASFDLLYLPELRRRGHVAPSVDEARKSAPVMGGAVLSPEPGLHTGVAVYDFKSLYPSLMRTFNLDPLALAQAADPSCDAITAPNGARFARGPAILPEILERFMHSREAARLRGDRRADQAIKIMMNSMFGVFAAAGCRFFSPELANAITSFGQQTLAWTREAFEAAGVRVLYGDTDSVFVELASRGGEASRAEAETLRARIESSVADRIAREYAVEAKLTLELEKIFEHFFLPRVRGGRSGSKKRYAGWLAPAGEALAEDAVGSSTDRLEVVGLEAVRRDWPAVARRLQEGMLTRLFRGEEVLPFVREVVDALRDGKLDRELVYSKRIRKSALDRYTASSPPHVQAARKLQARLGREVGGVIHYVIGEHGPEALLPGDPLPADIDRGHYLERVLQPVAESILAEIGSSFDEALGRPRQLTLL